MVLYAAIKKSNTTKEVWNTFTFYSLGINNKILVLLSNSEVEATLAPLKDKETVALKICKCRKTHVVVDMNYRE